MENYQIIVILLLVLFPATAFLAYLFPKRFEDLLDFFFLVFFTNK
ncbi:MAG: hypothetical protein UR64_C0018G0012 [Candidatus Nomurabacteria bacterium GW2011_GWE1_35_16]|uniref:Uncharacterized protein n=1 Tax=Candidatus Nomurabacteria bacterium GW2011_GWE1_35_16 TaxID=1618761 RepID=A0A0G0DRX9_9BACT|nr:MAG: hypothetical protein UR64_C0018G0012 [Candidatus Nomurabacteria bacterium GW2011_GWE1_35_16]